MKGAPVVDPPPAWIFALAVAFWLAPDFVKRALRRLV